MTTAEQAALEDEVRYLRFYRDRPAPHSSAEFVAWWTALSFFLLGGGLLLLFVPLLGWAIAYLIVRRLWDTRRFARYPRR